MDDKGNLVPTQTMPGAEVVAPGDNTKPMPASPYASGPEGGKEATSPTPEVATSPAPAATPAPKVTTDPQPSIWTNGFSKDAVQQSGKSIADAYNDYNQWAKENGKDPLDFFDVWTMFNNKDLTKSVEENVVDEKKAKRKEDWERVGNFLNHLANFVGTTQGAPSQQLESGIELTKRQQALRDKTLAQRQSTARDMIAAYRQKKADEQAKNNAVLAARKADREDQELKLKQDAQELQTMKLEWQRQYQQGLLDIKKEEQRIDEAYKKGLLSVRGKANAIAELRANYNNHGKVVETEQEVINRKTGKKDTVKKTVTTSPATTKKKNPMASSGKKPNPMK